MDDIVNISMLLLLRNAWVDLYQAILVRSGYSQVRTRSVNDDFKSSYNV